MKFHYLLAIALIASLISCGSEPKTPEKNDNRDKIVPVKVDYQHIINESTNDYPVTLRAIEDMMIHERMVLNIELAKDGSFTIRSEKGDWNTLKEEMNLFFNANRDLHNVTASAYVKDKSYRYNNYPFFSSFDIASYQSYIDRLTEMVKTDPNAKLYLQRHSRRIKAFQAVSETELPFIDLRALIRYVYSDSISEDKLKTFEEHMAKNIFEMRNELALDKFGINYGQIRNKASVDGDARRQLLYLQEMYPAYLLRLKESELDIVPEPPMEMPPIPTPPPSVNIIEEENQDR